MSDFLDAVVQDTADKRGGHDPQFANLLCPLSGSPTSRSQFVLVAYRFGSTF